jgi:hypothetical protein
MQSEMPNIVFEGQLKTSPINFRKKLVSVIKNMQIMINSMDGLSETHEEPVLTDEQVATLAVSPLQF